MPLSLEIGTIAVGLTLFIAYYLLLRVTSSFDGDFLILRRYFFGFLPFGKRRIALSTIALVRRFDLRRDWLKGTDVYGNLLWRKAIIIELSRGMIRRIFLTPSDPEVFMAELKAKISKAREDLA